MTTLTIRADITGTVWKIMVEEGAMVQEDELIMILESMKMEIPVVAPEAGRVVKLLVQERATLREGQEIVVFEAA